MGEAIEVVSNQIAPWSVLENELLNVEVGWLL